MPKIKAAPGMHKAIRTKTREVVAEGPGHPHECPPHVRDAWIAGEVALHWAPPAQEIKRWPAERKAKTRRTNLRRRLEKHFPLLADLLEADELAATPPYYAGQ
jgi:hypothetical protein